MNILEFKEIFCGYKKKDILKNINFTIKQGEFVGILGPNGSGKTTLLKTIARFLKPSSGNIFYKNENIKKYIHKEISKEIAVVLQNIENLDLSVEEFVLLGRIVHYKNWQFFYNKNDYKVAYKSMQQSDIFKLKKQKINNISSGEKQLANMAKALCVNPKLLLLDEPISNLDIMHQIKIMNLLKRLNNDNGITIITVLHELNIASQYCDKLIILKEGEIFKIGNIEEVLTYKNIEDVYKTVVVVQKHPISKKPYVFLDTNNI